MNQKSSSKALKALESILSWSPLVLSICLVGVLTWAMIYEKENYHYGCIRAETLVSYQPVSNFHGQISYYSYTTADGQIFDSARQFPLNQQICVEEGNVPKVPQ